MPKLTRALRCCLAALLLWLVAAPALAQVSAVRAVELRGVTYVDAAALALALGDVVTAGDEILTWRGAEGVVTFFAGSAEALLLRPGDGGADEWALSSPVLASVDELAGLAEQESAAPLAAAAAGWALPLDAVQLLGVAFDATGAGAVLHTPAGRSLALVVLDPPGAEAADGALPDPSVDGASASGVTSRWEMTEIAGAPALRFFSPPGKSLLLLDLDLAPLAFPEATAAVDAAVARAGSDHALLVVVSALSEQDWSSSLQFEQAGRGLEVRHPYRLRVYQGEPDTVGPGAEVAAIVLLPASFSLYQPLSVSWEGIDATVTFRR